MYIKYCAYGDSGVLIRRVPLLHCWMKKYLYIVFIVTQLCTTAAPLSKYKLPGSSDKPRQDDWGEYQPQTNDRKWSVRIGTW